MLAFKATTSSRNAVPNTIIISIYTIIISVSTIIISVPSLQSDKSDQNVLVIEDPKLNIRIF